MNWLEANLLCYDLSMLPIYTLPFLLMSMMLLTLPTLPYDLISFE